MRRRAFIGLLGGAAALAPLGVRAQQAMPVVGFLGSESPDTWASRVRAFHQGLSKIGFAEGSNVAIEYRWAEGHNDRLPALAADLVGRKVAVIATNGPAIRAAKAATATIPIVFQMGGDPVALGFVRSLNRPGGNLTGVTSLGVELGPKKLQMLHELLPTAKVLAVLVNPVGPNAASDAKNFPAAASALGVKLHVLRASTQRDLETAFANVAQLQAAGLVIAADAFFNTQHEQLAKLSLRHRVPAIYVFREFAMAGGLMSYGDSIADRSYQVGVYVGRILKGEKPGDLPVQQSAKTDLIVNLKTAKALGLTVPLSLLGRADEVIE